MKACLNCSKVIDEAEVEVCPHCNLELCSSCLAVEAHGCLGLEILPAVDIDDIRGGFEPIRKTKKFTTGPDGKRTKKNKWK